MSKENTSGLGVLSRYGPVEVPDGAVGVIKTEGAKNELTFDISHVHLAAPGTYLDSIAYLPAGSVVTGVDVIVSEAFSTFPNIDNVVNIGTDGSAATNGAPVEDADLTSIGHQDLSADVKGTWASRLAADTTVSVELSGTNASTYAPTAGEAKVIITYVHAANGS